MVQSSVVEIMMSMFALEMEVRDAMFMSAWRGEASEQAGFVKE
jgi:hypothetical protein